MVQGARWSVEWDRSAAKDLRKLDKPVAARILLAVSELEHDPRPASSTAMKADSRLRRLRVGDYRVVYEPQDGVLVVLVLIVKHRREVYDAL